MDSYFSKEYSLSFNRSIFSLQQSVWVNLFWGHYCFFMGPGAHKVVSGPSKSLFPVQCKFWQLYDGVNHDLIQDGLCHTQVCYTQSPCSCGSPLLTHTATGDAQTEFCLSLCGVPGSWCTQGLCEPS